MPSCSGPDGCGRASKITEISAPPRQGSNGTGPSIHWCNRRSGIPYTGVRCYHPVRTRCGAASTWLGRRRAVTTGARPRSRRHPAAPPRPGHRWATGREGGGRCGPAEPREAVRRRRSLPGLNAQRAAPERWRRLDSGRPARRIGCPAIRPGHGSDLDRRCSPCPDPDPLRHRALSPGPLGALSHRRYPVPVAFARAAWIPRRPPLRSRAVRTRFRASWLHFWSGCGPCPRGPTRSRATTWPPCHIPFDSPPSCSRAGAGPHHRVFEWPLQPSPGAPRADSSARGNRFTVARRAPPPGDRPRGTPGAAVPLARAPREPVSRDGARPPANVGAGGRRVHPGPVVRASAAGRNGPPGRAASDGSVEQRCLWLSGRRDARPSTGSRPRSGAG